MRTSNKIIIAAFFIFLASLILYDMGLRAEYLKGEYTRPFNDYTPLNYSGFDEIDLNASTAVNIMLVQGPFKVLANPASMDFLRLTRKDNKLIIDAAFSEQYNSINTDYILYISCPVLTAFKADARYTKQNITVTDTSANNFDWKPTLIQGFAVDSVAITENHASNIILQDNRINKLSARVGTDEKSRSNLTIGTNNRFTKTDLDILNKSHLRIRELNTNNLNYHLADSATLVVTGAAAKHLLKLN